MPTGDELEARLAAVERTLTDGDRPPADLSNHATVESRLDDIEAQLDTVVERLAETEGELAAVRGHVGNARRIDRETEQVAQRALATAREADARLDDETPAPEERPVPVQHDPDTVLDRLRELW